MLSPNCIRHVYFNAHENFEICITDLCYVNVQTLKKLFRNEPVQVVSILLSVYQSFRYSMIHTFEMELGNMSERQRSNQRADNS